jgi:hypothetical protein
MEAALRELASPGCPPIATVARKYGVNRSTLSRRFHTKTSSKASSDEEHRLLSNHQEDILIKYIGSLCEKCLPPTSRFVNNIAAELAGRPPSKNWCSRFVSRHRDKLDGRYLNTIDLSRHKADSRASYKQYFETIGRKIEEYQITTDNIYNMDEKGFMIGQLQKSHRVFTKDTYKSNKLVVIGQDGNREWITVLATICADGTALSPTLIYKAISGNIQDTWLEDFDPQEHTCHFGASPNGWTSDDHGFEWLQSVFDKETRGKARRSWRLLFLDGHSSHLNKRFVDWCTEHKILVANYPPHSTHRLQPLDVGCFAPLAHYYSQGLDHLIRQSEGHSGIKKRDFFSIFWPAFKRAFRKEVIDSAWSKTGIWPWNPEAVLKAFPEQQSTPQSQKKRKLSNSPVEFNSPSKRRKIRQRVNKAAASATPRASRTIKHLGRALVRTSAELALARLDNVQLRESLARERKHKKRQKKPFEQLRADGQSGTLFLSPSKVQQVRDIIQSREQEKEQQQQDKADKAQARALEKAEKQAEAQEKREARAVAAAERKAAEAARKAALKQAREARRAQKEAAHVIRASTSKARAISKKQLVSRKAVAKVVKQTVQEAVEAQKSRTGRIVKPTAKVRA